MTSIHELFATNEKTETEGFVHQITDEIVFTLARAGGSNTRFVKVMEQKTRPYRRQIQDDTMDTALANKLLIEAFAETVVLGWKGITTPDGQEVKFTPENAITLFNQLPDLFNELRESAGNQANYRLGEVKDDAGN